MHDFLQAVYASFIILRQPVDVIWKFIWIKLFESFG